jgi:hypothetical protein
MQKVSVDLIRLAVSWTVIGAVVEIAVARGLYYNAQVTVAKIRIAPPIQASAISVGAPALCWAIDEPIGATATQEAQIKHTATAQTCSSVAPILRRRSEPQSRLALTP